MQILTKRNRESYETAADSLCSFGYKGVPHVHSLLLGDWITAVVQEVSIPHSDSFQTMLCHIDSFQSNAFWVIIPHLMDPAFCVL